MSEYDLYHYLPIPGRVVNNCCFDECPLCMSKSIGFLNTIEYVKPVLYSTHKIQLEFTPELWRCSRCQSWFSQNIIPEDESVSLYQQGEAGNRWSQEPFEAQKSEEILNSLDEIFGEEVSVLDIGCNTGELLDYAKPRGCKTAGVEFSVESRAILKRKGHQAYESLENVDGQYDVITAFDLIEHLYDVSSFLESCESRLAHDGYVVILTGDISSPSARMCQTRWWYLKYPEHIVFPSRKYYEKFSGFHLEKWIPTYASLPYKQPLLSLIRGVAIGVFRMNYTGLPSLGPDHALILLRK